MYKNKNKNIPGLETRQTRLEPFCCGGGSAQKNIHNSRRVIASL